MPPRNTRLAKASPSSLLAEDVVVYICRHLLARGCARAPLAGRDCESKASLCQELAIYAVKLLANAKLEAQGLLLGV
jgi:hypothetical protein